MSKNNPKAGQQQFQQDQAAAAAKETPAVGAAVAAGAAQPETPPAKVEMVAGGEPTVVDTKPPAEPTGGTGDVVIPPVEVKEPVELRVSFGIGQTPEIAPVVPATLVAKVAEVAAAPVIVESEVVPGKTTLKDKLANILKNVPEAYQTDLGRIYLYLERMAPNRAIDKKAGAKEQVALYKSITNIINRQEQYFTPLFSALLAIFREESQGALSDRYRLRFMESIELGEGDRKAFMFITHLLFATSSPGSRSLVLKSIDMNRVLENGVTAAGRDRVLNFYNI